MTRTEPYVAWRVWNIQEIAGTGHYELESIVMPGIWPWYQRMESEHKFLPHVVAWHDEDITKCNCGIYGLWLLADTIDQYHRDFFKEPTFGGGLNPSRRAIGLVSLYGDEERPHVAVGPKGARAPYAYPKELWLPGGTADIAEALSNAYGVPASVGMPEHDNNEAGIHD